MLRKLIIALSTQDEISDESLERMAKDVEFIYSEGYRQQYSDLLNMLISIRNEVDSPVDDQNLCDNLESLPITYVIHAKRMMKMCINTVRARFLV